MIRIAITAEAFEAIAATLPLGSVGYENATNERGERLIWLGQGGYRPAALVAGTGESFSDVIMRLVESKDACVPYATVLHPSSRLA